MVKIKLTRVGKRNTPRYRIIVIPQRTKREGKAIEYLGHYNPVTKDLKIDTERAKYWLSVGAEPTTTVRALLVKAKVLKPLKKIDRPAKKSKKESQEEGKKETPEKKEPKKQEPKKQDDKKEDKKDAPEAKKEDKTAGKKESKTK